MADLWRVVPVTADTLANLATAAALVLNTTYTVAAGSIPQVSVWRGLDYNYSGFVLFYGDLSA